MSEKRLSRNPKGSMRLSREEWLSQALDYLAHEGREKLTIDNLVKALGVTKGSFYWHFRDRNDFRDQLLRFWVDRFTQSVIQEVTHQKVAPDQQLWRIMELVCGQDLTRYEIVIRAWANREPEIESVVRKVDRSRNKLVRELFEQLGFTGVALEMRVRSFVTYLSMELGMTWRQSKNQRLACLREFHQLVTSR